MYAGIKGLERDREEEEEEEEMGEGESSVLVVVVMGPCSMSLTQHDDCASPITVVNE